ncbi:MAG: bifunctional nuclease family protein [Spirochaetales bacterium]|nr:bifunctional nuclease family protein [Spirochaetales bacterium]
MLVPAEVWTVAKAEHGSAVLIRPIGSDVAVPIFIGQAEAHAILIGLGSLSIPRPLTHDLLISTLKHLKTEIIRIEITELKEDTFFARLILNQNGTDISIDSRPSDCIALAVRVKCPLYIDELVVDKAGISVNIVQEAAQYNFEQTEKESHLAELKVSLERAVEEENYEEAAKLRDKIRELEDKSQS